MSDIAEKIRKIYKITRELEEMFPGNVQFFAHFDSRIASR